MSNNKSDLQPNPSTSKRDLAFISGDFFVYQIPKNKKYLTKYYTTPLQKMFLKYYLCTGTISNFTNHTGMFCSDRILFKLKSRYLKFCEIYDNAKKSFTEEGMELIDLIESGRFRLTKLNE
jgi:hypothetical protein